MLETISITTIPEILWKKTRVVFPEIRIRLGCFFVSGYGCSSPSWCCKECPMNPKNQVRKENSP